jgi:hypothetical protein
MEVMKYLAWAGNENMAQIRMQLKGHLGSRLYNLKNIHLETRDMENE